MEYKKLEVKGKVLLIREDGLVIQNLTDKKYLNIRCNPQGYNVVAIRGKDYLVHRLVSLAWIRTYVDDKTRVVNHIDGNKQNNHYTNLEWGSYSDNNNHAYITGLRPDNVVVLIKNLETSEITRHYSINAAGRYLEKTPSLVYQYLKNSDKVRLGKYVLIIEGDEWPNLTKVDVYEYKKPNTKKPTAKRVPSRINVLNTANGEMVEWESLKAFADSVGMKKDSIERSIYRNGGRSSNSGNWRQYQITYLNKSIAKH